MLFTLIRVGHNFCLLAPAPRGSNVKKSVVLYTTSLTEGPENNTCEEDAASVHAIHVNRYTLLLLDEKFSGFQSQEEV